MLSDVQHLLLTSNLLRWVFDVVYLSFPILLVLFTVKGYKGKTLLAISAFSISIIYGIFFSGVSYISPEGYMGWILIPLIFMGSSIQRFYYNLHSVRLIFILMFFSAALWKIRAGGIFNMEEMAGILLHQHSAYLVSNKQDWFTRLIYYLVQHKFLAYALYLFATIGEGLFLIGFFTRKFDKYLIIIFCMFILFNFFIMRINYFGWVVFMGCFYFSRFSLQTDN